MKKKIYALIGMAVLSIVLLFLFAKIDSKIKTNSKYDFAMGTAISISSYGKNTKIVDKANNVAIATIKKYDDNILSWRLEDSEVYKLNVTKGDNYEPSEELKYVVEKSYDICQATGGALDITLRPVLNVWNIEESSEKDFIVPEDEDIKKALETTGYENIVINDKSIVLDNNVTIDLGATAKGYMLDVVYEQLKDEKLSGAVVACGGSIMVYGDKAGVDDNVWKVGIRNPKGEAGEMIGYLSFSDKKKHCVSTSGDYEKYFDVDGVRYHHIIDPATGYPSNSGVASVTIICEDGLTSDALSTACFIMGYEKSLPILSKYGAEAIFIDKENNIKMTDGIKDIFSIK